MREKECYRDNLERLDRRFPDKECLKQKECAEFLGCSPRTIKRYDMGEQCKYASRRYKNIQ